MRRFLVFFGLAIFAAGTTFPAAAQVYSTIEVGQATLSAYTTPAATTLTPFETISFKAPFPPGTTPNVFVMTPEFGSDGMGGTGDDPCHIRIKNVTNTGFDAVCIEPYNENRDSISVAFDYVAIEDGIVTIPTTTMGSSVTFESKCLSLDPDLHQEFQNTNCDYCGLAAGPPAQVQGYRTISFDTAFPAAPASPPALLTQLKTVANVVTDPFIVAGDPVAPIGEPEFIAVAARNVTNNGFEATIERLEAASRDVGGGDTFLTAEEEFCYLAVEQNGCQTLDLSGIGGSVGTVVFQAVRSARVIEGHDTAFGASFAASCFSGTPVAVASLNSRFGDDGGVIRRVGITSAGITLINDEDRVSNPERGHIDNEAGILAFGQAFTTPVTLSKFRVKQRGRRVKFDWQTSAESFHLGFHLWGETRDGWVQLNDALVPGHGSNTDALKHYRRKLRLTREQYSEVSRFGISSIDTSGYEEFYGPFEAGETYGESDTSEPIDWADTRAQFELSMQAKGYTEVNGRWLRLSERRARRLEQRQTRIDASSLDVRFNGYGIRKVNAESILNSQPSWLGMNVSALAVTLNGQSVARRVISDDGYLSADDLIVFNVVEPQGDDALYLNDYTYRLQRDRRKVLNAEHYQASQSSASSNINESTDNSSTGYSSTGLIDQTLTQDKNYLAAITSGSPWYDAQLFTTSKAVSQQYNASFDQAIDSEQAARLRVDLFGSIDLPADQDDHHVLITVNGTTVADERFDGLSQLKLDVELAAGLLKQTDNEIVVTLPGDTGLVADIVLVDELTVMAATALNEVSASDFLSSESVSGYSVAVAQGADQKHVFAYSSTGGFNSIETEQSDAGLAFPALPFLSSSNNESELRYAVVSLDTIEAAQSIEPVDLAFAEQLRNPQAAADLMIVAHPNFIGDDLQAYIDYKRDLGLEVQLVDWLDLVAASGFANNTPQSLDNYLSELDDSVLPKHMLLVGGHTYDYRDRLGQGAVNFIPAHYRKVSIFEYTQSDNVYADLNGDNLPDIAIGRWPVRTASDLQAIIAKSIKWQELHDSQSITNDVLLIAQPNDGRNLDFESSLEGRVSSYLNRETGIAEIERVYLGQSESASPVADARVSISESINEGTRLVSFAGHASTAGWGFQGIVNTALINSLTNEEAPTVVMPLACYTTDYQSLHTNTLAHQWMFAGNQGAAAVHGATSLGKYRENGIFAERVLKESATVAVTLGEAIMRAKQRMSSVNETLHNWALLGDPTLPAP